MHAAASEPAGDTYRSGGRGAATGFAAAVRAPGASGAVASPVAGSIRWPAVDGPLKGSVWATPIS